MSTVILTHVDRYAPARLLPALRREVGSAGATCTVRMVQGHMEVTITTPEPGTAPLVADGVVRWYLVWRRSAQYAA